MNNIRRYRTIFCYWTAVCKPSGVEIGSQKIGAWCHIISPSTRLDVCPAIVTAHSTPLNHCLAHPNSGIASLTHPKKNQCPIHPELRSYEKRLPKVSKTPELFDLLRWNRFAKHAIVSGGGEKATYRPLRRISADKELDIFSITRSSEGSSETIFASQNLTGEVVSSVDLPVYLSVVWDWLKGSSTRTHLAKDFTIPVKYSKESIAKLINNTRQHNIFKTPQLRRLLLLSTSAASLKGSYCHFHSWSSPVMAKSKFEYVRQFEADDPCLPNCWVVVRIDGKAFHKFTDAHHYMKPNDERGLSLMTRAAQTVMSEFNEIVLAYGQSDEYSFVFHKNCKLYNRRSSKIMTNVVSLFASSFTLFWPRFFNSQELQYPPSFDGRVVLYPSDDNLKDYLSWRQADCHINNLYNTCFWKLVQEKGLTPNRAAERLKGTLSSDKNELLFSEFNINYNNLPELYRKGSVLIRPKSSPDDASPSHEKSISNHTRGHDGKANKRPGSVVLHTDIIGKQFWEDNPHILNPKSSIL